MRLPPSAANRLAPPLFAVICLASASDPASGAHISNDRVEAVIESAAAPAYTGEMLLLKVRTTLFGKTVALEDLKQPALQNFAWTQLAPDRWSAAQVEDMQALRFERVLALFPTRSGSLTIDPFVHHLTVIENNNLRRTIDLQSNPVEVEVQAWGSALRDDGADSWWLPAQSLVITDKWQPNPERIPAGETARRTVIIQAAGLTADRLPEAPKPRSPGLITFAHPVERETLLTPAGPIARAVYGWDVRPATPAAAVLQAFPIPWFDTRTRRMREALLPARRIAFAREKSERSFLASPHAFGLPAHVARHLSGLAAFAVGLAILLIDRQKRREPPSVPMFAKLRAWRQMGPLRRAARLGDAYRFRGAVCELARRDARRSRVWLVAPPVRAGLMALDLHLFGASRRERPDLGAIAAAIRHAWFDVERDSVDPIALLDVSTQTPRAEETAFRASTWFSSV